MPLPPRLERELAELRVSHPIEISEDANVVYVSISEFPLGEGYTKKTSTLLLQIPRSYPDAGPDMFWVEHDITLDTGVVPQAAESIESYLGQTWRRFSWHRQGGWNPTVDNLHGYVEFIRRRLRERK
jgi:hypothetical protein